jgi:hypothetical protein
VLHLSGVPVTTCLSSTRKDNSKICAINCPQTETTALSRSWKKTATAIGVFVSKLYVTFCGAADRLWARVTVC